MPDLGILADDAGNELDLTSRLLYSAPELRLVLPVVNDVLEAGQHIRLDVPLDGLLDLPHDCSAKVGGPSPPRYPVCLDPGHSTSISAMHPPQCDG